MASEKDKPDKALSPLKQVLKKEVEPTSCFPPLDSMSSTLVRVNPSRCSASMSQERERERKRQSRKKTTMKLEERLEAYPIYIGKDQGKWVVQVSNEKWEVELVN